MRTRAALLALLAPAWTGCVASPTTEAEGAAMTAVSEIRPFMKDGRNGRLEYLAEAHLFGAARALTPAAIKRGQPFGRILPGSTFSCHFETPGDELSGASPKFACSHDGVVYKVKFLPDLSDPGSNRELYGEVAGSRLAWLLGLGADAVTPVEVDCADCPRDPRHAADATFNPVTGYRGPGAIEFKLPGAEIEASRSQRDVEGWRFRELDAVAGLEDADPLPARAEVDALRLFASLLQHWDCKADNQRLLCPPDAILTEGVNRDDDDEGVLVDTADLQHCMEPQAFIHDLGDSFGHDARFLGFFVDKLDLGAWSGTRPLRQDGDGVCWIDSDPNLLCDGLGAETIGDAGRRFLVERLQALMTGRRGERSLSRLAAVFAAARVDRLGDSPEAWAAALAAKVDAMAAMQCTERPVLRGVTAPDGVEPGGELALDVELHDADGVAGAVIDVELRRAGDQTGMRFTVDAGVTTAHGYAHLVVPVPTTAFGPYILTMVARDAQGTESNTVTRDLRIGWGQ